MLGARNLPEDVLVRVRLCKGMSLHRISTTLWRYRIVGLLLALAVTFLLIVIGTHSIQHSSYYVWHKDWHKTAAGEKESDDVNQKLNMNMSKTSKERGQSSGAQVQRDASGYGTRIHSPPVAFLKIHKTGSSTVQNMLFRMGERRKATFAFPYYTYQFSYPDKFRAEFVDELPDGSSQFDILCSHMRLDLAQLKRVMPLNTVYITILREPLQTFESIFSYYTAAVPAFNLAKKAAEEANRKSALSVFLESPYMYWDPRDPGNGLAKNPMSFDLGLTNQEWNSSWSADLTLLEETFQLVMIAEYFDESLVLLGDLLKLELKELAYVHLNCRSPQDITPLDNLTKARIRAWNHLDVSLYDYFLQLFWEKTKQYGRERLNMEVAHLRASTEGIRQGCLARNGVPPGDLEDLVRPWQPDTATILGYEVLGNLTEQDKGFCVRLVLPELQYHGHLYFQQYGRDMRAMPTD